MECTKFRPRPWEGEVGILESRLWTPSNLFTKDIAAVIRAGVGLGACRDYGVFLAAASGFCWVQLEEWEGSKAEWRSSSMDPAKAQGRGLLVKIPIQLEAVAWD